ncbi:MAG: hypothetical protein J5I93_03570 [Pirellulaceae bacterium]|nr:hypothetical protein [Pirellulaceae bacterium]
MSEKATTSDRQFTFLDETRRQVIFTPKRYDPRTGLLAGVNQQGKPISVAVKDFIMPHSQSNWIGSEAQIGGSCSQ